MSVVNERQEVGLDRKHQGFVIPGVCANNFDNELIVKQQAKQNFEAKFGEKSMLIEFLSESTHH